MVNFVVFITVAQLTFTAWLTWLALRNVTFKELRRFSDATGLELTTDRVGVIGGALRRGRLMRFGGALAGLVAATAPSQFGWRHAPNATLAVVAGFALGALIAGLAPGTRGSETPSAALLAPRRIGDYIPRSAWRLMTAALALDSLALAVWRFGRNRTNRGYEMATPFVPGIGAVMFAALTMAAALLIVRRRQSAVDLFDVQLDDALRTRSMHLVVATGLAAVASGAGAAAAAAGSLSDVQLARWTLPWFGFAMIMGAWFAFNWYRSRWWRVTRTAATIDA
jgi:hypothetical protein